MRIFPLHFISKFFILFGLVAMSATSQARSLPDFVELAEENSPAVVNISTKQKKRSRAGIPKEFKLPNVPGDSPLNEFFEHFLGEGLERFQQRDAQSLGSGFVISEDGYILTNHHVVDGADEIQVSMHNRKSYTAEFIGSDKNSDVALLKIDASGLDTVKIGKSSELKVGEWVLAIGSPFGFDHSVTAGIVSAKGRSLPNENYVPFIQTDVAVNPGNSGGPLFNLDGEVIGVNSQIYSQTGGFMGLSFAIPIELAMGVVDQLRTTGHVSRGYLGVLIQDVDQNLAESFGLDSPRGALVAKVVENSPAQEAGIQTGDIILSFEGTRLYKSSDLPPLVGASGISGKATLVVMRNGKEKTISVQVGELEAEDQLTALSSPNKAIPNRVSGLDIVVKDVSDALRDKLQLTKPGGVVITQLNEGAARSAGLRKGDIIQMFDGQRVKDTEHMKSLAENAEGKRTIAVLIYRDDGPLFLALRLK